MTRALTVVLLTMASLFALASPASAHYVANAPGYGEDLAGFAAQERRDLEYMRPAAERDCGRADDWVCHSSRPFTRHDLNTGWWPYGKHSTKATWYYKEWFLVPPFVGAVRNCYTRWRFYHGEVRAGVKRCS